MGDPIRKQTARGVTLLEILMAMVVMALITSGIFTAFVFGRRVSWRTEGELLAQHYTAQVAEELRLAVTGPSPSGLVLTPGIYVDQRMRNEGPFNGVPPTFVFPVGATGLAALNLPDTFRTKYQTNPGSGTGSVTNHGDGRMMVVEDHVTDRDGDGKKGFDFNVDNIADMVRVKVKIQYSTPNAQ